MRLGDPFQSYQGPGRSRPWVPFLVLAAFLGCGRYERVQSEEGLRIIQELYTAVASRNQDRLNRVGMRIERAVRSGKINGREERDFREIVDLAANGSWERAVKKSYQYARDQAR